MSKIGQYRAGISALIWDPNTDQYLLLRRSAHRDAGAGEWESVTGRLDQGEGYPEALHREVGEELGVTIQVELLLGLTHFYRGEHIPENEMLGVHFLCAIQDPDAIQLTDEHEAQHWMTAQDALDFLPDGYWLARLIQRAETMKALIPEQLRDLYRDDGFAF